MSRAISPLPTRAVRAYVAIEGEAFEGVGSTLELDDALEVAVRLDARRDAETDAAARTFALIARQPDRARELASIGLAHARRAERYDRESQAYWETAVRRLNASSRARHRACIGTCEALLTEMSAS